VHLKGVSSQKQSSQGLAEGGAFPVTSRPTATQDGAHHPVRDHHPPSPVVVLSTPPLPPPLRPLRAHPPLRPTAISGSRVPRSPPYTTTLLTIQSDREAQSTPSSLSANHQPGGHFTTAGHLSSAPPYTAPPGADNLLRCCYPREA
jgi:hypothetical protein